MLTNNLKKHIKQLHQKKFRKEFDEFLVEGIKGVGEAIDADAEVIALIVDGKRREEEKIEDIIKKAEKQDIEIFYAGRNDIPEIQTTETFPGIMAVIAIQDIEFDNLINDKPIVCIDGVNDPGNLGTIIRTADWFGVPNILLSENSVEIYNEKVVRSTMGSMFRVNIFKSTKIVQMLEKLKKKGYSVYALDMEGKKIGDWRLETGDKTIFVFGSESHGISDEIKSLCNEVYTIPRVGEAESLNLGVAVGIVLSRI